jgi:cell division protein FtsL
MAANNIKMMKSLLPKKNTGSLWLLVIFILFAELMAYTWIRTESTQARLRISKAEERLLEKRSYHKALLAEMEWLKSDARITRIAGNQLNLSTVTMDQTIYLSGEDG